MSTLQSGVPEPQWLTIARDLVGLKEIHGQQHEPKILALAKDAGLGWIKDDETAWCAIFVGGVLKRAKIAPSGSAAARSYLHWGRDVRESRLEDIPQGAILVFERPPKTFQGHVGFADGYTADGFLKVLGGNQADSVSIADINVSRLIGARWPIEAVGDMTILRRLPLKQRSGAVSTNEA
jgi:uncharacterized protein (TIGR02594 family)